MMHFFSRMKLIGDNLVEAVYPVTLIVAGIGFAFFLFRAIRQKRWGELKIVAALFIYFFCITVLGFYRSSNRYLLLLILPSVFFCGYLFNELFRKKPIFAYLLAALFAVSFAIKHCRIDTGVAQSRSYLTSLSKKNAEKSACFFALENRESRRCAFYSDLPLKTLTQYDFTGNSETMLQQTWQRYLYEYDVVYLGILLPTEATWHPAVAYYRDRCDFQLDFEIPRGLKKRKTLQIFRLSNANTAISIPSTATNTIPLKAEPQANFCRFDDHQITPQWYVTDQATRYVKAQGTDYQVLDHRTHWEIRMASDSSSCLRTNAIDLSKPFDCYIEYYGEAEASLDVSLTMQRGKIYRDNVVAYLPLRGDDIKKCVRISFYPSMNPENLKAFLLFRLPARGHIHITRMAFSQAL